jgi:hypothetical protein
MEGQNNGTYLSLHNMQKIRLECTYGRNVTLTCIYNEHFAEKVLGKGRQF